MLEAIKKRGPFELFMYILAIVIVLFRFIPFVMETYHAIPHPWIEYLMRMLYRLLHTLHLAQS